MNTKDDTFSKITNSWYILIQRGKTTTTLNEIITLVVKSYRYSTGTLPSTLYDFIFSHIWTSHYNLTVSLSDSFRISRSNQICSSWIVSSQKRDWNIPDLLKDLPSSNPTLIYYNQRRFIIILGLHYTPVTWVYHGCLISLRGFIMILSLQFIIDLSWTFLVALAT